MSHLVPSYRRKPRSTTPAEPPAPTPDAAAATVLPPVPAVAPDKELEAAVAKLSKRRARRKKKGTTKK